MSILDKAELRILLNFYSMKYINASISRAHAVLKFADKEVDHSEVKVQDVNLRQAKDLFIACQYLWRDRKSVV